jgi:ABC-2 type transport system permease protein
MNGGRLLWLIDKVNANMDSLRNGGFQFTRANRLNLRDQLFTYGARINEDLIMDLQCNKIPLVTGQRGNQPKTQMFPWYYFPVVTTHNNHPINRNISPVSLKFANTIDTVGAPDIEKTVLLKSSQNSKAVKAPTRLHFSMLKSKPDPRQFPNSGLPLGVLLEGRFESLFKNRLTYSTRQMIDTLENASYRDSSKPTKQIVIGDGDIIRNEMRGQSEPFPLGYYRYTQQTFGNKDFLLNAIEYLIHGSGLIKARNKNVKLRLLDRTQAEKEKRKWQIINLSIPIGFVIIFGFIYSYIRKRRYTVG